MTPVPTDPTAALRTALGVVGAEVRRAQAQHGPMASGHEAQSVIGEEFHEFTLAVWFGVDQRGQPADPQIEAIQTAAMAVRYLLDVNPLASQADDSSGPDALDVERLARALARALAEVFDDPKGPYTMRMFAEIAAREYAALRESPDGE